MKKYKLFGIINIIDLLAIIIVVLAGYFVTTKFFGGSSDADASTVTITFSTKEVSDFVVEKLADECSAENTAAFLAEKASEDDRIHKSDDDVFDEITDGCRMYDDTKKVELGKCTSIKIGNSESNIVEEGKWYMSGKPDYSRLEITSVANGRKLDNGYEIGGETYFVGDYVVLRAGVSKIYIQITNIDENK